MKNGDSASPSPTVPLILPTANTVTVRLTRALVLQPQILTEALPAAFVVAVSSPGLMAPPPRPRQHRFVRGMGRRINQYSSRRASGPVNGIRASSHSCSPPFYRRSIRSPVA